MPVALLLLATLVGTAAFSFDEMEELSASTGSKVPPELLAGLLGKSEVDCGQVCKDGFGTHWLGMSGSSRGQISTTKCTCGNGVGQVVIQCVKKPFQQCCENECPGLDCPTSPTGWQCPDGKGCPAGNCKAKDWQDWVAAHNVYRCMHDVPPVVWNEDVYQSAFDHFDTQTKMEHSKCYDVPPPAGPAGENLFWGTGKYNAMDATSAWYSEITDCGPLPGCRKGATAAVGHFTAMIWHGDKEIGCHANQYNVFACRYKSLDFLTCNTPNFGGLSDYQHNVYPRVKTYAQCKKAVEACGLPVAEPLGRKLDTTSGLHAMANATFLGIPTSGSTSNLGYYMLAGAGVVLMGLVAASLTGRRLRRSSTTGRESTSLELGNM